MRGSSACFPSGDTDLNESGAKTGTSGRVSPESRGQLAENFGAAPESAPSTRVIGKQVSAFAELVRPFERAIYLVALAFVYDPDEAVEVAQESVLHAFKSLSDATTAEQLRSRLIDIVIDKAKAFLRERKQADCADIAVEDEPDILDLVRCPLTQLLPIPSGAMSLQQTRDILSETLGRLPRKFRVVVFLRDVLGFTTVETAQRLGTSEETIRKRLAYARFGLCTTALDARPRTQAVTVAAFHLT